MIHAFKNKGHNIILDVASGSIHEVDDMSFDVLSKFDNMFELEILKENFRNKYPEETLVSIFSEIGQLYSNGTIYSADDHEKRYNDKEYTKKGLKAICLNIAHDCNLSCEYCFASKGDYRSKKELMNADTAKRAIRFLADNSGDRKNLEVDFFGGEPLLNFDVVKQTVEYARSLEKETGKRFKFTMTTNGTIMNDEIISYLNDNMENLVISIDGRKEVHDKMRQYDNGDGSFEVALDNAKKILDGRDTNKSHYIRGTYTRENLDFSKDVELLSDEGFTEISIEPVVGSGGSHHLLESDIDKIKDEYDVLVDVILDRRAKGKKLNFYHFNANIYGGPCIYKRISACGAGFEYLAISPSGKIYPCHQFVNEACFELGDIYNGIIKKEIVDIFENMNIYSKPECTICWAKYFCSGGCHANSYFSNGDISKPNKTACELQKKRIESAILLEIESIK